MATEQEETLRKLGFLGEPAGRAAEWAAITAEFDAAAAAAAAATGGGSGGSALGLPAFTAAVESRYWHWGVDRRLPAACFRAFDYDGTGSLNLHEYALFHAAVVRCVAQTSSLAALPPPVPCPLKPSWFRGLGRAQVQPRPRPRPGGAAHAADAGGGGVQAGAIP